MILFAESGSSKCDWAIADHTGCVSQRFTTAGLNPFSRSFQDIESTIRTEVVPKVHGIAIDRVLFYGAGVIFEKAAEIRRIIESLIPEAAIETYSDMDAAVRATVGDGTGIVCILGTGSNSCYVENGKAVQKVASLGYILGDEGSGNAMGKRFLGDILKGLTPEHILSQFNEEYGLNQGEILERVYRQPMAASFLAGFSRFLAPRQEDPYVRMLVDGVFSSFVTRCIEQYPKGVKCWFVGSVAVHFEHLLRNVLRASGHEVGEIIAHPIDRLIQYHTSGLPAATSDSPTESFRKITEERSLYDDLEKKDVHSLLTSISTEDHRVADAVQLNIPNLELLLSKLLPRMKQGGRLFYMGAGTSGRLGVLDASEIPPTFGMPPGVVIGIIAGGDRALRTPVEGAEDDTEQGWKDLLEHGITEKDTVIGIAASGTTPYVIGALKEARKHGILTASISSNRLSPLSMEADIAIETVVGPEFVSGSSRMKSGTAQKMVLNMITTCAMIGLGRVKGNKMVNMQLSNKKLIDRGTKMIVELLGLDYDNARRLLLMHGSVQKALDAMKEEH